MTDGPMRLDAVRVPGDASPWESLGFSVAGDGRIDVGNGAIRVGRDGIALAVTGTPAAESVDGVSVSVAEGSGERSDAVHPNGALELDHVVVMTDSLERTSAAVESVLGLPQRRTREAGAVRQAFHRFADEGEARGCIVEVVERDGVTATALWGLVVSVVDLDAAVACADGLVGAPKDAVQPGRRIATVRREAGLPLAVALMSTG